MKESNKERRMKWILLTLVLTVVAIALFYRQSTESVVQIEEWVGEDDHYIYFSQARQDEQGTFIGLYQMNKRDQYSTILFDSLTVVGELQESYIDTERNRTIVETEEGAFAITPNGIEAASVQVAGEKGSRKKQFIQESNGDILIEDQRISARDTLDEKLNAVVKTDAVFILFYEHEWQVVRL